MFWELLCLQGLQTPNWEKVLNSGSSHFWGANCSWVMMGTLGDSSVGPCDLSQLCPAGALDGRCSGEGTPGTSSLQLVICRSTPAILLSSTANGNIPKWKCRNNLELKAAFVHSLIEKLPFSPDTLQPLNRSCILIFPTINPHQQSLCYSTGVLQKAKRLQKGKPGTHCPCWAQTFSSV